MTNSEKYQQILDNLLTAVIVLDRDLKLQHMNASAENLLSLSMEQLRKKTIDSIFAPTDRTPGQVLQSAQEERSFTKRKAKWLLHNQNEITVDFTVTHNAGDGSVTIEVQALDRLLRINREEALISSQETSRNLIRSLAHEIKNPLGGIRGAAQLLAKELIHDNLDDYTKIIIDETDRLRNLVDRMLGPRTPAQIESLNVHEVVEHVVAVTTAEVGDKIEIVKDYDPSIPDLLGDKDQLIQALLNVARNACQALLESKETHARKICFTTRVQMRFTIGRKHFPVVVRIGVHDNGPGIPPDMIEGIFFPMITGRAEGSGLGLAIAQNIVNQHHGIIECESVPGDTEFAIYLPLGNSYE